MRKHSNTTNLFLTERILFVSLFCFTGFAGLLHESRLLLNRMQLFVQQVQYSFSLEVLDVAWTDFQETLAKARSLDDVLAFHNDYLTVVEEKCFIQSKTLKNTLVSHQLFYLIWNIFVGFTVSQVLFTGTGHSFAHGPGPNREI